MLYSSTREGTPLNQKRSGFTLIELLVVIAIIAILAAILFPMLLSAKQRAQAQTCLNSMGQIGKAIMMYADDNGGYTPFGYYSVNWGIWNRGTWRERIRPYTRNIKIIMGCPVKTHEAPTNNHWPQPCPEPYPADYSVRQHYGMNVWVVCPGPQEGLGTFGYRKLSSIQMASKTILVTENKDGDWSGEPWTNDGVGTEGQFWPYHGGKDTLGGNFIWCDGHASFLPVAKTELTVSNIAYYYWRPLKKPW